MFRGDGRLVITTCERVNEQQADVNGCDPYSQTLLLWLRKTKDDDFHCLQTKPYFLPAGKVTVPLNCFITLAYPDRHRPKFDKTSQAARWVLF